MRYLVTAVATLSIVAGLVLPAVAAYQAVYVTIGGLAVLTALVLINGPAPWTERFVWMLLAALGLVTLSAMLTGPTTASNWLAPAILILPLLSIGFLHLPSAVPALLKPGALAMLALAGAGIGFIAGAYELLQNPGIRAGAGNNPIHYGGIVLLLGFAALAGFEGSMGPRRYVYLLGPAFGLAGVFLSGSRGPFLAACMLLAVLLPMLVVWHWRDRKFLAGIAASFAIGIAALLLSPLGERAAVGIVDLYSAVATGDLNAADVPRSQMLEGTFLAFLDSPFWGHGWADMMAAAERYFPQDSPYKGFDHLHADISNFAVLGGLLGLAAYGLLLAVPLRLAAEARPEIRREALILALVTSLGFAGLGLTNAMFGVLPQTTLFAVFLGWLVAIRARE